MAETLSILSTISFVVSAILFAVTVFLWFKFKIPAVFGDLTGRTARKSIAQMRAYNEQSGRKAYRTSAVNAERGKLTANMENSSKFSVKTNKKEAVHNNRPETGLLQENHAERNHTDRTELLVDMDATAVLVDENETELLPENRARRMSPSGGKKFVMLEEVILIHTNEAINLEQFDEI